MHGRAFLDVAQELAAGTTEAHWRAAMGRAYYALLVEGRDALQRWGFVLPRGEQVHAFVRLRFSYAADAACKKIGAALDRLVRWRNQADYQTAVAGPFTDANRVHQAIDLARDALQELDSIENYPVRRAAVIAAIRAAWP